METFDMLILDINSFCEKVGLEYLSSTSSFSDFSRNVYASDDGVYNVNSDGFSKGNKLCLEFRDSIECRDLACEVYAISKIEGEKLNSLLDKIGGKIGFKTYEVILERRGNGEVRVYISHDGSLTSDSVSYCANEMGHLSKLYCGCTGTNCRDDNIIDSDCTNDGGWTGSEWSEFLCIEGDIDNCCVRAGYNLGQCARLSVGDWAYISSITIRGVANCHANLDVYARKSSGWERIANNIDGNGENTVNIEDNVLYVDICTDRGGCDHRLDWVRVN